MENATVVWKSEESTESSDGSSKSEETQLSPQKSTDKTSSDYTVFAVEVPPIHNGVIADRIRKKQRRSFEKSGKTLLELAQNNPSGGSCRSLVVKRFQSM